MRAKAPGYRDRTAALHVSSSGGVIDEESGPSPRLSISPLSSGGGVSASWPPASSGSGSSGGGVWAMLSGVQRAVLLGLGAMAALLFILLLVGLMPHGEGLTSTGAPMGARVWGAEAAAEVAAVAPPSATKDETAAVLPSLPPQLGRHRPFQPVTSASPSSSDGAAAVAPSAAVVSSAPGAPPAVPMTVPGELEPLAPVSQPERTPYKPMRSEGVEPGAALKNILRPIESEHAAECKQRYPHLDHMSLPVPRWRENVFIALNLHNSGHLMAALHRELLRLAYWLAISPRPSTPPPAPTSTPDAPTGAAAAAAAPAPVVDASNVFISIYESNSGDNTGEELKKLDLALTEAGVPHNIVVGGPIGRDAGHRINGYAKIRNAALAPMYDAIRRHRSTNGAEGWLVDRVLFINDVFWCAEDGLRLLAPGDGGDENKPLEELVLPPAQEVAQALALRLPPSPRPALGVDGTVSPLPKRRPPGARPHMVCAVDYERSGGPSPIVFYDHWVMRDRAGQRIVQRRAPFFADEFDNASYREARRMDVVMCWGGMVALDGRLFSEHGLTLRARTEHCGASECAHIASDIIALHGVDAWIQQDNMAATTYNSQTRDQLAGQDWFNVANRLRNREATADARAKANIAACSQTTGAQGVGGGGGGGGECPALAYPLSVYKGTPTAYPPSSYCCGEFLSGQNERNVYWMNCRPVVTQQFTQQERDKIRNSDFDPFVDLQPYTNVPHEWV